MNKIITQVPSQQQQELSQAHQIQQQPQSYQQQQQLKSSNSTIKMMDIYD